MFKDAVVNGIRERRGDRWRATTRRRGYFTSAVIADLKYGCRLLTRSPGFAAVAVSTLALGVGLAAAIFSVAYQTLWRPLPYRDEDRVTMLWEFAPAKDILRGTGTPANFLDWRARNRRFSNLGALAPYSAIIANRRQNFTPYPVAQDCHAVTRPLVIGREQAAEHRIDAKRDQNICGDTSPHRRESRRPECCAPIFVCRVGPTVFSFRSCSPRSNVRPRKSHFVDVVARLKPNVSLNEARRDTARVVVVFVVILVGRRIAVIR